MKTLTFLFIYKRQQVINNCNNNMFTNGFGKNIEISSTQILYV